MKVEPEKIMLYLLRICFCILLISIWAVWLISLPEVHIRKNQKGKTIQEKKILSPTQGEAIHELPQQNISDNKIIARNLPENTTKTQVDKKEKKIVALSEQKQEIVVDKNKVKPNTSPTPAKEKAAVNLSNVALATKKELLKINPSLSNTPPSDNSVKLALRKEIPIKTPAINPPEQNKKIDLNENLREDWLPKYLAKKKEIFNRVETASNNLDQIASQLEIKAIISSSDGNKSALIKNNITNKTETLKAGDEYLNLKIIEIGKNEVILGNESLNKKYIKKLLTE